MVIDVGFHGLGVFIELLEPYQLMALYIAGRTISATGSCDAGGFSDGHVRSGAADVRVDAAVGFGLTLYPVRRLRLAR